MENYNKIPSKFINLWGDHPDDFGYVFPAEQQVFSMIPHFFYEFNEDPNIKIVYAGPNPGNRGKHLLHVPIDTLREHLLKITTPTTKLCFDNLFEGNITPIIHKIYQAIEGTNIDPSQIYLFSSALKTQESLDRYCLQHGITKKIHMYSCTSWEYDVRKRIEISDVEFEIKPKKKTFLCMNRISRFHRIILICLLIQRNLLEKGFCSFFHDNDYGGGRNMDIYLHHMMRPLISQGLYEQVCKTYEENLHRFPLVLNIGPQDFMNWIRKEDKDLFTESQFSVVTETFFFDLNQYDTLDEEAIFFNEKTFKPIAMKHPFILVSKPHALKWLKKLNYKTFHPFIDESYDDIEDHEQRLLAIVREIERLDKMTPNEWEVWQKNVKPIVEHNHQIMHTKEKYAYVFSRL